MWNSAARVARCGATLMVLAAIGGPALGQNLYRSMNPQSLMQAWKQAPPTDRPQIADALLDNRAATLQLLRAQATSGDAESKRVACGMLGELRDTGALPALLAATADPDEEVQARAVTALRSIGNTAAAPRLRQLVRTTPSRAVLKRAIVALGKLGGGADIALIRPFLAHADQTVQVIAAGALAMRGNREGQDFLLAAIDSDDPLAQKNATLALGYLDTAEARARITQILNDPASRWKSYALIAQTLQDRRGLSPAADATTLENLARGRDRVASTWAMTELTDSDTPEALQALQRLTGRSGRRGTVAQARLKIAEGR